MRRSVDRELVERLLQDESLSYREIARRADCSDFSVRAISRELGASYSGDSTNVESEPFTAGDWWICISIMAAIFGGIWLAARYFPPSDGMM